MSERISALMDGEHAAEEFAGTLGDLREPGEALETWRTYHLISDALRDTRLASPGFAERVNARILEEPTVMALAHRTPAAEPARWMPLYAAASVAAVVLVGWVAFVPPQSVEAPVTAKAPPTPAPKVVVAPQEPARLPLTSAANDYLLAHQAYSPRNTLQGVAPYARTVSDRAVERKR